MNTKTTMALVLFLLSLSISGIGIILENLIFTFTAFILSMSGGLLLMLGMLEGEDE